MNFHRRKGVKVAMEAQADYKPDGITEEDTKQQLANALDKAIQLITDMSIRKVAVPWDTIQRWQNLIKYAKKSVIEQLSQSR